MRSLAHSFRNTSCLLAILLLINTSTQRQGGEDHPSVNMTNGLMMCYLSVLLLTLCQQDVLTKPTPPPCSQVDGQQMGHACWPALQSVAPQRCPCGAGLRPNQTRLCRWHRQPLGSTHYTKALEGSGSTRKKCLRIYVPKLHHEKKTHFFQCNRHFLSISFE